MRRGDPPNRTKHLRDLQHTFLFHGFPPFFALLR